MSQQIALEEIDLEEIDLEEIDLEIIIKNENYKNYGSFSQSTKTNNNKGDIPPDLSRGPFEPHQEKGNSGSTCGLCRHSPQTSFYIISFGYLLFTLTDSAIHMVILLELYNRQFNALEISLMFTLYEFFGIITNLVGGIFGSKWGFRFCLILGLINQIIGISLLCGLQSDWTKVVVIIYIIIAQGFSGIAKDLIKMSGKSVTKLISEDDHHTQTKLFQTVAWLTGAKNSIKGFGFLLGALLLYFISYIWTLIILLAINVIILPFAIICIDTEIGKSKDNSQLTMKSIFNKGRNINILSFARVFLFGSRDIWFEVALPIFLRHTLEWTYMETGAFLAGWTIFYGAIQSATPQLILNPLKMYPIKSGHSIIPWSIILNVITVALAVTLMFVTVDVSKIGLTLAIIIGLFIFGFIFAINSSIHSFLILAYCNKDKVAMNVGFYYMSNAVGRLLGLLTGGLIFYYVNFDTCIWASAGFLVICNIINCFLGEIPLDAHQ